MAEKGSKPADPPPPYSDATGDKGGIDLNQMLSTVGDNAPKLVKLVNESMQGVCDSLEKLRKAVVGDLKAIRPSVSSTLEELRQFMTEVVRKCRSYCSACRDLGEYASDSELIKEIKADLDNSSLDELNDYLDEIDNYLETCQTRFGRVEKAHAVAKKKTDAASKDFEQKYDKALEKQRKQRKQAVTMGTAGGGLMGTGAIATFLCPPAGIAMMLAGSATSAAAAGLTVDAGFTQNQIDLLMGAFEVINSLARSLGKSMDVAKDMREEIDNIKESGAELDRLKQKVKKNEETRKLKGSLNTVKRKFGHLCDESTRLMGRLNELK